MRTNEGIDPRRSARLLRKGCRFGLFFFAALLIAGSVAGKAGAAGSDDPWDAVRRLAVSGLEKGNIPSVSIAVAQRGRVVWEQSFGWADRERRIPASPETVYSLASTTKPMVATAVMILARAGKIDLDAPVERYIGPGLLTIHEGRAADVTVRRLLHHTAGLPQHFNYFYADESARPPALEDTLRRFGIIIRAPGDRFLYANLGYAILGHVVARVSGKPLEEFLRDEVFRPLDMASASFEPGWPRVERLAAEYDHEGKVVPFHVCDTPGSGQGYASARDLLRFGMFHLKNHRRDQRPILDDDAIDRMQTEKDGTVHPGDGNESYGLGWFFADAPGGPRMVWHEGGWTGTSVLLKLVPAENIAVAVLMNVYDTAFVNEVADAATKVLIPGWGSRVVAAAKLPVPAAVPSFDLPDGIYSGVIRTLERDIPVILEKTAAGGLAVRLGGPASPPQAVRPMPAVVPRAPGQLLVHFPGPLGDSSARTLSHSVNLDLRWSGGELVGIASAMTLGGLDIPGSKDPRMHFILPYRVALRKTAPRP